VGYIHNIVRENEEKWWLGLIAMRPTSVNGGLFGAFLALRWRRDRNASRLPRSQEAVIIAQIDSSTFLRRSSDRHMDQSFQALLARLDQLSDQFRN